MRPVVGNTSGALHVQILFTHYHVVNAVTQDPTAVMQSINTVLFYGNNNFKKKIKQLDRADNYYNYYKSF